MSASKTQVRLQQVTGSLPVVSVGSQPADPAAEDLQDLLDAYAKSIANIHGEAAFLAQVPGLIEHSGRDVTLRSTTDKVILDSGDAANDALKLDASAGGLVADINNKFDITARDTGSDAIMLKATAGGIDLLADAQDIDIMTVGTAHVTGSVLALTGSAAVNVNAGNLEVLSSGGGSIATTGGGIQLKAGGSGAGLFMSGAAGVTFATETAALHGGFNNHLDLATPGEGFDFVSKFGTASILGAILDNQSNISAGEPSIFSQILTGTMPHGHPLDVTSGNDAQVFGESGVSSFPMAEEHELEVYVNGQLLLSSSAGRSADYVQTAQSTLEFSFDLEKDDVVVVYDRT